MPPETIGRPPGSGAHKVMRGTGIVFLLLAMFVPIVTFVGYTTIWIIELRRALGGLPSIELPGPPWDTWQAIIYTAVLTMIGGYFFNTSDTSGGRRIIRGIVALIGRRTSGEGTDTVPMRPPAREADEPEE